MRSLARVATLFAFVLLVPALARGQGSIAGLVRDSSGAVLPGVTVEAASPALIEKVRTAVSDGSGQYRIVDLRPGIYSVVFTLPGFATIRREGIELTGDFTASVNAEMRVGALEETITVSGETPIVDVQSAKRQQVVSNEIVNSVPAVRAWNSILMLVPSITGSDNGNVILNPGMITFGNHGGPTTEGRLQVDGINVGASRGGAGVGGYLTDIGNSQEVTFSTSGGLGEAETGRAGDEHRAACWRKRLQRVLLRVGRQRGDARQQLHPGIEGRRPDRARVGAERVGCERRGGWSDQEGSAVVLPEHAHLGQRDVGPGHVRQQERGRSDQVDV